jgi:leucyl aminopeptidase
MHQNFTSKAIPVLTYTLYFLLFFFILYPQYAFAQSQTSNPSGYVIQYPEQVKKLFSQLDQKIFFTNLQYFTDTQHFPDRGASHQSGVNAEHWLQQKLSDYVKASGRQDTQIFTIATKGQDPYFGPYDFPQPSLLLKIGNSSEPGVVIGAHLDTHNCDDEGCIKDPYGPLPGANDDGSGAMSVLELARVLLNSQIKFKAPIYLMLYAAEEEGSFGSRTVVNSIKSGHIPIKAVMQLDQTGYAYHDQLTMYLQGGSTVDANLTEYLKTIGDYYLPEREIIPLDCLNESDEWSWTQQGYSAARPLETNYCDPSHFYPYHDSQDDSIDKISSPVSRIHMMDYLKLATAFAVELAEPVSTT